MFQDHCIVCWRKKRRGEDLVWYNLSQTQSILENCLVMFVCPRICSRIYHAICFARKQIIDKSYGLLVFASHPPLGGEPNENFGRPWNLIHSPPCITPCRLVIHEVLFGPLGLHPCVWSELGRSLPFKPMRALRLQWSWAFNLCVKWPLVYAYVYLSAPTCSSHRERERERELLNLWQSPWIF